MFCGFCSIQYDGQSGIIILFIGVFMIMSPEPSAGYFLEFIIFTLHFTGRI